jgi:hypothetical protein
MKPKEITVRVDPDLWRELDDKRHAERTTFQSVGIELFRRWLRADADVKKSDQPGNLLVLELSDGVQQFVQHSGIARLPPDDLGTLGALTEMLANQKEELLISALRHMAHAYRTKRQNPRNKQQKTSSETASGPGRKAS